MKELLNNDVTVYTTPFKHKSKEKVFINTIEGVDRALYSELVEVRRQLSEKLNIAPVSIFLTIHWKSLLNVNQNLNKK